MEKDAYTKMKVRFDMVIAFINNKEAKSLQDFSLVPLLVDYVEKGDLEIFEKYKRFLDSMEEQRRQELDDADPF